MMKANVGASMEVGVYVPGCCMNVGNINMSAPANSAVAVCDFPLNIEDSNINEYDLYHLTAFDVVDRNNREISGFSHEIYIPGDIDHNGIVDAEDESWLMDYNLGMNPSIRTSYIGVSSDVAELINTLAADVDGNGEIGLADLLVLERMLED